MRRLHRLKKITCHPYCFFWSHHA